MRHRIAALPLAAMASIAVVSIALAGGWAEVTVTDSPADPPAGQETNIELRVLQHGVTPVSWPNLIVVATDDTSGDVVRTQAEAQGPEGSYVAAIAFPHAGEWTLTFESDELVMAGSVTMSVASPSLAGRGGGSAAAGSAPASTTFDPMPLLIALLGASLIVGFIGVFVRRGTAAGEPGVSVRT
jgi:hypothetical protein